MIQEYIKLLEKRKWKLEKFTEKDCTLIKVDGYYDIEDDLTGTEYHLSIHNKHLEIHFYTINFGKIYINPYEHNEMNLLFKGFVKNEKHLKEILDYYNL